MNVNRIKLVNFRNYEKADLSFDKGVHILIGDNAQGKTNALEAIFLAVLGKSFRAGHDEEMIRWNCDSTQIDLFFSNQIAENSLSVEIFLTGARKNILNGQNARKRDIVGSLNAVLFCPEDLWLIKGTPALRRRFIDFMLSKIDQSYYSTLLKYNRVILQRNNLLKKIYLSNANEKTLDIWDEQLFDLATSLYNFRIDIIKKLSVIAETKYNQITIGAESFSVHYFVYGLNNNEEFIDVNYNNWYKNNIRKARRKDILRGVTEIGPHKDDITFLINSHDAKYFASQGQQRTAILSLKLAEVELIKKMSGEYPVLLLDDVMSELDLLRRRKLVEEIDGKIQTFLTGTDRIVGVDKLQANYYFVTAGSICQI